MPDIDFIKYRPPLDPITYQADLRYPYVELQTTSNFSFLKGASHPEEFVQTAAQLGYHGIALTDHNTLAGVVRGFRIAKETGIPYFIGCKAEILYEAMALASEEILDPEKFQYPCFSVLLHPISRAGYGSLCTLLTLGKRRTTKDHCLLTMQDLLSHTTDLACTIIPPSLFELDNCTSRLSAMNVRTACADLCASWCDKKLLSIALTRSYLPNNEAELQAVIDLAKTLQLPLVATNDARYHIPQRKPLHDVVTCIRAHCTIQTAGYRLMVNQERYLKPPAEMYRLFRDLPQAITRTLAIAEMTKGFSLAELRYEYPSEICPATTTPTIYLRELVTRGIQARYPAGVPEKIQTLLTQELAVIAELAYESYFLTCYDIVRFAREKKILCQGRGAAANSAVCYALGITAVDPNLIETLFARFVSKEREEPPDIDIDFEHERREEVIQYIYEKYGRERAGLTATVISYRSRSAIRDVGKALGWPPTIVDRLAKLSHYWTKQEIRPQDLRALGLDPHSAIVQNLFSLVAELVGFPRHLSQHVGGFIISARPLSETVPILNAAMEGRTTIEWDKDDIELLGLLKLDILALGMLTCIRKALDFVNKTRAKVQKPYELYSIPTEDPAVYQMISAADTIGVFQIESRAQMSMLPRLKPNCFYDLVIQIAIVRPGPIHGDMVHPYLRRRDGIEPVSFPDERVAQILRKTLGVPLFQEQAMRLAIVMADFTPGEAEKLRRAMAAWKHSDGIIQRFKDRIITGMLRNGYKREFAETCMHQLRGFSEYGFPESHSASFALLAYASAWLKCHHPAEFAAALLNSLPMGFYDPAQIISDAQAHGVPVRAIDINYSNWDHTLEPETGNRTQALRLGMRIVKGLGAEQAQRIIQTRAALGGKVASLRALWFESFSQAGVRLRITTLQALAEADAFQSMGLTRRAAEWEIAALPATSLPLDPLFEGYGKNLGWKKGAAFLPRESAAAEVTADYQAFGFSLKNHPISFLRAELATQCVVPLVTLQERFGRAMSSQVAIAGMVILKQRPGTAKGFTFITIEDETGIANLVIHPKLFERFRQEIMTSPALIAQGKLERVGQNNIYLAVRELRELELLPSGARRSSVA